MGNPEIVVVIEPLGDEGAEAPPDYSWLRCDGLPAQPLGNRHDWRQAHHIHRHEMARHSGTWVWGFGTSTEGSSTEAFCEIPYSESGRDHGHGIRAVFGGCDS